MENTTRLLQRHEALLTSRHVLVVGADDLALTTLMAASVQLHSDDTALLAEQAAMLPVINKATDLLVVILPKSREQLAFWLSSLAGQISEPMDLWLVGASNGGVRGGVTTLKGFTDEVVQRDSARHCKLFCTKLRPADFSCEAFEKTWTCDVFSAGSAVTPFQVSSYPGVFSHGRPDPGTDLLLQTLEPLPMRGSVLDVGCGAGVISVALAQKGCAVTAVDVSATAVFAARKTLSKNALEKGTEQEMLPQASAFCSDVFNRVQGRFDQIVTNPPFHDGTRRTTAVTQRLIEQAPQHLAARGVLWLVANQGLPYGDWLRTAFTSVEVAAENNRFRVWRAQR